MMRRLHFTLHTTSRLLTKTRTSHHPNSVRRHFHSSSHLGLASGVALADQKRHPPTTMNPIIGESRPTKDEGQSRRETKPPGRERHKTKLDEGIEAAYCFFCSCLPCCSISTPRSQPHNSELPVPSTMAPKDRQPGQTDQPALPNGAHANGTPADGDALSQLDQIRDRVASAASQMTNLFNAIRAPLPTQTGDGSKLPQKESHSLSNDLKSVIRDINKLGFDRVEDLAQVIKKSKLGQPLDDKQYYMVSWHNLHVSWLVVFSSHSQRLTRKAPLECGNESAKHGHADFSQERLIQAASMLPPDGVTSKAITSDFITTLWKDLEHPPQDLMADEYDYRQPDGSKNSLQYPHIGKAGMPYARTTAPQSLKQGAMPDPGVLFDTVMARKDPNGKDHPNRVSSMLFYLASIIIHDAFKTNRNDYNYSDTSSYLDLAPLYGSTWADQKRMRTMKDGKIKLDCFSETRLLTFPPGVGALLIMFNRYHNYVVEQLALINEDGRFTENGRSPMVERYGEKINKRDDDLFQTGRLITCGLYINIILIDYVRTILNLNRTDDNWQLNPRMNIPDGPPRGVGNQVSAEFNLVYRWHAAVSERDDRWTQALFRQMFPDANADQISTPQGLPSFLRKLGMMEAETTKIEPENRPFPALEHERLTRIKDGPFKGTFEDNELAALISASIDDCANAMGPQQVPTVMKAIEILGITQARSWRVGTLNEFRKHFDLEPHRTFESITKNAEVAEALKHLYDTPDDVELYPGLVVEDAKDRMDPGSGLCPSYTVSRGVLSDAVALVRGDRHYTTSYTPAALTNWGFQEASSDLTIDNGCVAYKLFLRALPHNFDPASVYVHYPFTTPEGKDGMRDVLNKLGKAHKYNFDRPSPITQPNVLFSYEAAKKVLEDQDAFHVTWGKAMVFLMGDAAKNFMLSGDGPANAQSRKLMENALFQGASSRATPSGDEAWLRAVREYYADITERLLADKTYTLAGVKEVDIIRDVGNLAHVHFAAELFSLPLKTVDFPRGIFTEQQLYLVMAAVFICVFFDLDPPKSFPLRQQAHEATQQLGNFMQLQVTAVKATGSIASSVIQGIKPLAKPLNDYGVHMISHLLQQNDDVTDLVWGNIMGTMGGMVANQGQLFGQVIDYFFTAGREHIPELHRLARANTPEADDLLTRYLLEASRLNAETGVFRSVQRDISLSDSLNPVPALRTLDLHAGDKVMVNLRAASRDPAVWSTDASGNKVDPDKVCLTHPLDKYIHLGHGAHRCLGAPMTTVALTTMLKVVFKRENLRPAPVAYGRERGESRVKKVVREFVPGDAEVVPEEWLYHAFLTEDWSMFFPFPTSESSSLSACRALRVDALTLSRYRFEDQLGCLARLRPVGAAGASPETLQHEGNIETEVACPIVAERRCVPVLPTPISYSTSHSANPLATRRAFQILKSTSSPSPRSPSHPSSSTPTSHCHCSPRNPPRTHPRARLASTSEKPTRPDCRAPAPAPRTPPPQSPSRSPP